MSYFVAFYSFKGGVGRTLALANVAYSLAERGKRVVLLDLDLEAPGLRQFKEFRLPKTKKGFLDYASLYSRDGKCGPISEFVHSCEVSFDEGELWLMPSGKRDADYQDRLSDLSWRRLHPQVGTALFIEGLQKRLIEQIQPHYVLIDARTGLSDVGGLSTNLMADMVVLVFNLTQGCIEGSAEVYESFMHAESRPKVVQLVASPVPPSAGGKGDRVEKQIELAAKAMPEAMRYGREIVRLDYDAGMVLADELAVTRPSRFPGAQRYDLIRESIQQANPNEVWMVLEYAREQRQSGRLEEAVSHLRDFAEKNEDNAEGWLELGSFLLESGQHDDAIRAFRKCCGIAPRFALGHRRAAEALLAAGQAREAVEELDRAEELGDKSVELLGLKTAALAEIGDTARYVETRQQYAAKLFGSIKGSDDEQAFDATELHRQFVEVLELRPPYPGFDAENFWGLLMGSLSNSVSTKAAAARALLAGEPNTKHILELQGELNQERRQCIEMFGPAVLEVHQRVAKGLYDLRDKKSLEEALRGDVSDVAALRWAAAANSNLSEKAELLRRALEMAPGDRRVLNDCLRVLWQQASEENPDDRAQEALKLIDDFEWAGTETLDIELETGGLMGELMRLAQSPDLRRLLVQFSMDRSELACELDPRSHAAWGNWGNRMMDLASVSEGEMRRESYEAAIEKFEQAQRIKPDSHLANYNWGVALLDLASISDGETRRELYESAIEKYEQALAIKPDYQKAICNWGNALSNLASISDGETRRELYESAIEKYEQSLEIKPDYQELISNWAADLVRLASLAEDEKTRQRHLLKARELCHRANEIEAHSSDYNLACAESLLGDLDAAADFLTHDLLRNQERIEHALDDSDFDPLWTAEPDLRVALEQCHRSGELGPLEAWIASRET